MGLSLVVGHRTTALRGRVLLIAGYWWCTLATAACQDRSANTESPRAQVGLALDATNSVAGSPAVPRITEEYLSTSTSSTEFVVRDTAAYWPRTNDRHANANIIVCWARSTLYSRAVDGTPVSNVPTRMRWIADALSYSWSRYLRMNFFHRLGNETFWTCGDESEGQRIILGFGQTNFADRGYATNTATRVLIDLHLTDRDAVQQAAFVMFGQALRVLGATETAASPPTPAIVAHAQAIYGVKPSGKLVNALGYCAHEGGKGTTVSAVIPWYCDPDLAAETWHPVRLTNSSGVGVVTLQNGNNRCLLPFGAAQSSMSVGVCADPAAIEFKHHQWKSAGELCVGVSSGEPGSALTLTPCREGSALTRWNFDFVAPRRISLAGISSCVEVVPSNLAAGAQLVLVACGSAIQPEFLSTGQIGFGNGLCASIPDNPPTAGANLTLGSCSTLAAGSRFHVTGRPTDQNRCATMRWNVPVGGTVMGTVVDCTAEDSTDLAPDRLAWDYYW